MKHFIEEIKTMKDKLSILDHYQNEANTAKERLMDIMSRLEEEGLVRRAKELGTIIGKLEGWQHKGV